MRQISEIISDSIAVKQALLADVALLARVEAAAADLVAALRKGNKVLFCGNGGSAADAQHLAAELSGRFYFDRPPLYAEALHVNTSYVTAVANDYSYDEIFSRSVRGSGRAGDVLVALTTSGNSRNVLAAVEVAKGLSMSTIALTGETGGKLKGLAKHLINVPSRDTARIQESHILLGHALCEQVEESLFPEHRKPK
jgi:D-sedoheptulose 7-phosphate isomerase